VCLHLCNSGRVGLWLQLHMTDTSALSSHLSTSRRSCHHYLSFMYGLHSNLCCGKQS
jgi:hypothetical protein